MSLIDRPRSYFSPGLLDESIEENRKKLSADPGNHLLRHGLANALMRAGRVEEALAEYKTCVEQNPSPEYQMNYGKALLNAGCYEETVTVLQRVVAADLRWPDAYFHLARAYRGIGDLTKADELLRQAIALHPKYREAINELAQNLEQAGRPEDALREYKKVIALFFAEYQFEDTDAYDYELSVLFDRPELVEESIRQLRQFVQKYPGYADGYYKLGQALEAKGLANEAMLAFRRALEINPRYESARRRFWKRS
ncbi:MAG TPA: tetratricopeptide repeat protein [Candidatus Ozemobacteraceae bacterium]|mgnify:CR=1 FL=1|nr:tetratricopeptide repeat protein [Candidatus Ozemobacteraceae bacterium]